MWLPLFLSAARAESVLDFKTTSPVAIWVDGQQAILTKDLHQRVGGLEPGVHTLQVNGVFGKTLYEAEIDLPDGTLTTTEWNRGELRVVKTEWLPKDEEARAGDEAPEVVDVAPPPVPVAEDLPVVPVPPPAAPVAPPLAAAPPVAAPVAAPPLAVPREPAAAPPAAAPPAAATAMPPALRPRTLTVQATDGMTIDVVYQGRTLKVVVDGDAFRIEDPTGAVLALGAP